MWIAISSFPHKLSQVQLILISVFAQLERLINFAKQYLDANISSANKSSVSAIIVVYSYIAICNYFRFVRPEINLQMLISWTVESNMSKALLSGNAGQW